MAELHEESYKQGFVDGVKSKVTEELTDVISAVVKGMYEAIVKSSERIIESVIVEKIDVQPVKRGRWLNNHAIWIEQPEIEGYFVQAECSECGRWAHKMNPYTHEFEYDFCPHCGADMRGEENG